jgi:hypothetical protein
MPKKNLQLEQPLNVNIDPSQTPILYTDMIFISTNEDGVTFDVCQKAGNLNQLQVVSRLGMSREHAVKLAKKLSEVLALTTAHSKTGEEN